MWYYFNLLFFEVETQRKNVNLALERVGLSFYYYY